MQRRRPEVYEVDALPVSAEDEDPGAWPLPGGGDAAVVIGAPSGRVAQVLVRLSTCATPTAESWRARVNASDDAVEVVMLPPARLLEEPPVCAGVTMHSIHEVGFRDAVGSRTVEASFEQSAERP